MKPLSVAATAAAKAESIAEKVAFTVAMNLPEPVQRRLAGPPVVLDGQTLATDTQLMLKLAKLSGPAVETLPIPKGRLALVKQAALAGGAPYVAETRDLTVEGRPARLYVPTGAREPGPLLVFIHGGGFIYGGLESHDAACRFLAERSGVRVLAVTYRLAPEHPFPAAYDDALAGFRWAIDHADQLGADPARIGVGGDSAGGNLAAGVALAFGGRCAFQLLVYPTTTVEHDTESARLFGEGFFLTSAFMELAGSSYVAPGTDPRDPHLAPMWAEVPDDLAPAYLCTAGFDPLRDEGEAYAAKLADAGVKVEVRRFEDQIHGFLNVVGAGRSAKAAAAEVAAALRSLVGQ